MIATTPSLGLRLALAWISALGAARTRVAPDDVARPVARRPLALRRSGSRANSRSHLALRLFARASAAPPSTRSSFASRLESSHADARPQFAWRMIDPSAGVHRGRGSGSLASASARTPRSSAGSTRAAFADAGRCGPGAPRSALRGTSANRATDLSFSYLNFVDIRAARPAGLEDLFAFRGPADEPARRRRADTRLGTARSANLFDVLRVRPSLGRGLMADDDAVIGKSPVAVISHALWQRAVSRRSRRCRSRRHAERRTVHDRRRRGGRLSRFDDGAGAGRVRADHDAAGRASAATASARARKRRSSRCSAG